MLLGNRFSATGPGMALSNNNSNDNASNTNTIDNDIHDSNDKKHLSHAHHVQSAKCFTFINSFSSLDNPKRQVHPFHRWGNQDTDRLYNLPWGHTAKKRWSWDLNPGHLVHIDLLTYVSFYSHNQNYTHTSHCSHQPPFLSSNHIAQGA